MSSAPALWVLALAAAGCDGCEDPRAVPFKRGTSVAPVEAVPVDAGAAPQAAFEPLEGERHEVPTGTLTVDGAALELAPRVALVSLAIDLDDDGDRDLVFVMREGEESPNLVVSLREPAGWAAPRPITALASADEDCALTELSLSAFAPDYVGLWANAACEASADQAGAAEAVGEQTTQPVSPAVATAVEREPPPIPENQLPPGAASAQAERRLWVVSREASPRVVQHVAVLPATSARARIGLAAEPADLDGDAHGDLKLVLSVTPPGSSSSQRFELGFYNRPGGLARAEGEPETTLRTLANEARVRLKRDAPRAVEEARYVLGLHRALCTEGGEPALRFGPNAGLACGSSLGAGRAASIAVAGLARAGKLFDALELQEALEHPAYRLTDNDRARVTKALEAMVGLGGYRWRAGPQHTPGRMPEVHRATLAFESEDVLRLRGGRVASHDLRDGSTTPVGIVDPVLMTDPTGAQAVVDVFRSCEGYHLRIVAQGQVTAGVVTGATRSEPLVEPRAPPAGARCPTMSAAFASDDGGFVPLAWTSEGVLLARGDALWLLELDAQGRAQGPARALEADAGVKVPPLVGPLTPDGERYALVTARGIAIVDRRRGVTRLLPPPSGVEAGTIQSVALSPSARRIAILAAGRVHIAEPAPMERRPAPPSTASTPTRAPSTPSASPTPASSPTPPATASAPAASP